MNVQEIVVVLDTAYTALINAKYVDARIEDSTREIAQMRNAYIALAPDWSSAPDDAKCYAIDANGEANWFEVDVNVSKNGSFWSVVQNRYTDTEAGFVELPIGIDWRLCKWQRPEVK